VFATSPRQRSQRPSASRTTGARHYEDRVFVTTDGFGPEQPYRLKTAEKKPANKNGKIVDIETFGIGDVSTDAQAAS